MGATMLSDKDFKRCLFCGEYFTGEHTCDMLSYKRNATASNNEIIDKLSKIENLLQKIYEELRTKR